MKQEASNRLKVVEALQDDAYKGIARIDTEVMRELGLKRGDVISIKGNRETIAIVDRAYPADLGEKIVRIDGIIRRNAKTGIGEVVEIRKTEIKEAKKVTIAPAQKGVMVQGDPESMKRGLLGRAVVKGDIVVLGGVQRRKDLMSEEFEDIFGDFLGEAFGNFGLGGIQQIRFVIVSTTPNQPCVITENTEMVLNPKAVEISEEKVLEVTYEDIGGLTEEVRKIREMVELPLKHPEIFLKLGIEPPKGVLLHGPPGTGKTLLAKAVANEAEANFISVSGPEIFDKFYGESEKNIKRIFDDAEKNAPSIIFFDEIDAIAPSREDAIHSGEVERRVVSQLLTMMDGLKSRGKVIVIAATNRINAIDAALRRPGRFDREVEINVPNKEGRLSILKIHTRNMPIEHWDSVIAGNIMLTKLQSFNKETEGKIENINEKIKDIGQKINRTKKELEEKNKELKELENSKRYSEENTLSRTLSKIRFTKDELSLLRERIEKDETFVEEYRKKIEKLKKDIIKILDRKEQIGKDKKLLEKVVKEVEELKHQLKIRSSDDIRLIFYERKLEIKDKELNDIITDLVETEVVSENYLSDVNKESKLKLFEELAAITHGFVGADISALAKEAAMSVLRKNLPKFNLKDEEEIPKDILEGLKIAKDDFDEALKFVRPSALREVAVETPNVRWEDIGGIENVKRDLREAIEWPMKYPESFIRLGIRPPRGILMYGSPGTGKTLLAKAVAKESEANFIQVDGPELQKEGIVGHETERLRKMFKRARQVAPCIIFFDEIDSFARRRGGTGAYSESNEALLNTILTEMDGLEELKGIVVVAATNRPDMLDPALLRPGRFDRLVLVPVPNSEGRLAILNIHTKNMPLDKDVRLEQLSKITEGYTGADIESLCREAAMLALREDKDAKIVRKKHFEKAMEKVPPSVSKQQADAYARMEHEYLKSAKAALEKPIGADYLG